MLRARFPLMADALAERAAAQGAPLRVLDAGLGQAKLERLYQHRHPERPLRWHGLDLLGFRLRLRLEVGGISRVQGDLSRRLPYAEGSFDAVVCSWVLQHLRDPAAALAECRRVLRPGGLLLLAVPNNPQPLKLLRELLHPAWVALRRLLGKRFSYEPQIQFYDLRRLRRLLAQAGLELRAVQGIGFVTGGPLRWLEDRPGWLAWNLRQGARWPGLTKQLLLQAERPAP